MTGTEQNALTGQETILAVDDEPQVIELVKTILERYGYTVMTARSGVEAMAVWGLHSQTIALLFVDLRMPGMNGAQLIEALMALKPGLKVLFTSGYGRDVVASLLPTKHSLCFVEKPYTPRALAEAVRRVLDG